MRVGTGERGKQQCPLQCTQWTPHICFMHDHRAVTQSINWIATQTDTHASATYPNTHVSATYPNTRASATYPDTHASSQNRHVPVDMSSTNRSQDNLRKCFHPPTCTRMPPLRHIWQHSWSKRDILCTAEYTRHCDTVYFCSSLMLACSLVCIHKELMLTQTKPAGCRDCWTAVPSSQYYKRSAGSWFSSGVVAQWLKL